MKNRKRILAVVLTAIMTVSMLPSAAFATEAVDNGAAAEPAVETVSATSEEKEVETTTEDVSEEKAEEAVEAPAETAEAEEVADPAAADEVEAAPEEAETAEEAEEAEPAEAAEAEEAAEETEPSWPVTQTVEGNDYTVTAVFGAEAGLPADAQLKVEEIKKNSKNYQGYYDQALDTVQKETEEEVELSFARFFDIAFLTGEGEVEPTGPVSVNIKYDKALNVESKDDVSVLHFDDNKKEDPQLMEIETDGKGSKVDEVSFDTDSFSIYAVVGTSVVQPESRMALEFYNGSNLIATMYVKNDDDTDAELEQIIYDPGVGKLNQGELFKGWILDKADYKTEDVANKMTIAQIRTWAKEKTNADAIKEGDTYKFYAMIFKTFSVTYKDEDGATIHSEALIFVASDGSVDYKIYQPYTPKSQDEIFLGWYASPSDKVQPKEAGKQQPYENNTEVTITDNITFSVYAPKGHWLNFEENGKGASYTAPQFIKNEDTPVKPNDPIRNGYVFDGWYTGEPAEEGEDPTGELFTSDDFNRILEKNTTLYAKWRTADSANYSVIIWKQRVSDDKNATGDQKTYDVEEVITLSGTPGETVSVVSQPNSNTLVNDGRGNTVRNYSVNNVQKSYTGFHAAEYDQNVKIAAEGTTVVNVHYDRNLITIGFNAGSYTEYTWGGAVTRTRYILDSKTGNYVNQVTYTGLFDAPLDFVWPTSFWINNTGTGTETKNLWHTGSGNGNLTLSFYGSYKHYIQTVVNDTLTFDESGSTPVRFIRQKEDGSWPTSTDDEDYVLTVMMSGGNFSISEKYAGFSVTDYRTSDYTTSDTGWTAAYTGSGDNKTYVSVPRGYRQLNIRFTRDKYPIIFWDGTYFNGDGAILQEYQENQLIHESDDIYYEADVSSYNKGQASYYTPAAPDGYVFAGWFVDPTCTVEYNFTTMPAGGIQVYAKWVQKEYRVFLHPNVPATDGTFTMGNQATSFKASYNEKIAGGNQIKATRDDYDLIGWYADPDLTQAFNFDAFKLNDTNVTTPYDQTENTELDKYGNVLPNQDGYNKDRDYNRFWINRKLDLYAKWRSTLDGAKGIDVVYDAGEGDPAPEDPLWYLDNSEATAGAAPTPNDETQQFMYWVIQTWDGTAYVDTDEKVYPGDVFNVRKANAKAIITKWVDPQNDENIYVVPNPQPGITPAPDTVHTKIYEATYTVVLRAEYGDKDAPTPTHINWYANNKTGATVVTTGLQINEAVDIKPATTFKYEGYEFLGWARLVEVSDESGNVTTIGGASPANLELDLGENDLFVKWDGSKYVATAKTGSGYAAGDEVKQIAADEELDYHGMVAVWKAKYGIYHSATGEIEWNDMPKTAVDLTKKVTADHLYGGYYHYEKDGDTVTKGAAYTASGITFMPTKATVYYLKEVPKTYLRPAGYVVYNRIHDGLIMDFYGIVNVDTNSDNTTDYLSCGVIINPDKDKDDKNTTTPALSYTVQKDGVVVEEINGASLGTSGAALGAFQITDYVKAEATVQIRGYWVTQDNVKVTGYRDRMVKFDKVDDRYAQYPINVCFTGWIGYDPVSDIEGATELVSNTKTGFKTIGTKAEALTRMLLSSLMSLRSEAKIAAPSETFSYTVKKVYGSTTETQTVEEGDQTGKITYQKKTGYVFAGWYQDQKLTVPADFTNVSGDMTVYAKYVSKKDITLTFSRKKNKTGSVTFDVTAAVKNTNKFTEVGVNCDNDGKKSSAVLNKKSTKKTGTSKKPVYTYSFKGSTTVKGLKSKDTFKAVIYWVTPDGTEVTGDTLTCNYKNGKVTVR